MAVVNSSDVRKMTFDAGDFEYDVEYCDQTIRIQATHNVEYLVWTKTISDPVEALSSKDATFKIPLDAAELYNILLKYKNKADTTVKCRFPTDSKGENDLIYFEIQIPILDHITSATICLQPQPIAHEDRMDKKFAVLKNTVYEKITELTKRFEDQLKSKDLEIAELNERIESLQMLKDDVIDLEKKYGEDIPSLKADLVLLQTDASTLKTDASVIKTNVLSLITSVKQLQTSMAK